MKKFYSEVSVNKINRGMEFTVTLDKTPFKTPDKKLLVLPSFGLAEEIANEWRIQEEIIKIQEMPMTQIAITAVDIVANDIESYRDKILSYAETDLICYQAESPLSLITLQNSLWQPLVDWASDVLDSQLVVTSGVIPVKQPVEAIKALSNNLIKRDLFDLAALGLATMASGSLIVALALSRGFINADEAFKVCSVDERWQIKEWGTDKESENNQKKINKDLVSASRCFDLYYNS